jgi:Rap1a immunity proteins
LLLLPALSLAQGRDGPDDGTGTALLRYCVTGLEAADGKPLTLDTHIAAAYCGGRVLGLVEMHNLVTTQVGLPPLFCVPEQITLAQVVRVVVRELQRHPETLQESGVALATKALQQVFPCAPRSEGR